MLKKRIFAGIILFMLVVIPFLDWRLGAMMWMSAWLTFIFQKLFDKQKWKFGGKENKPDSNNDAEQE